MNKINIYPADFAAMTASRAGQKYRPSNGTEGECFIESWCGQCARDKAMRESADFDDCDDNEVCEIIGRTFAHDIDDPEYPIEWQYGKDGQPRCTAFVPDGQSIPLPMDEQTVDMFAASAPDSEQP